MKLTKYLLTAAALLTALLIYAANIWLGPLNLDEGWYLYSALSFADGKLPYKDFFFTQAPLLPVIYGKLSALWSEGGILGGRIFTAVIGFITTLIAAKTAATATPKEKRFPAALTTFLLLGCNLSYSYFTTIPKTYALASLFVVSGFYCLSRLIAPNKAIQDVSTPSLNLRTIGLALLSGFLIALAASTRLSLGALLLIIGLYLLVTYKRHGLAWLFFGIGGFIGLGISLLPFILQAPDAFAFANFFHGGRETGGLLFAAGALARLMRDYTACILLSMAALFLFITRHKERKEIDFAFPALLLLCFAGVLFLHLTSPFPYEDYNTPIMPILAIATSIGFWQLYDNDAIKTSKLLYLVCAGVLAITATSPRIESLFIIRKDRFWVEKKTESDITTLRRVASEIKSLAPKDGVLLTQDTYLAVEAGMQVPQGFEMGPFGYFPELDTATARKYKVLNRELAKEAFFTPNATLATISGYSFAMAAPAMTKCSDEEISAITRLLELNYKKVNTYPDFGQEHTKCDLYMRR